LSKRVEQSGGVGTQRFAKTRGALDRGGMVRTCPTSSVRSDGLVEPQPETKANVMEILIRTQLVEAECGTVADFLLWSCGYS
jgi:hypothetical protein